MPNRTKMGVLVWGTSLLLSAVADHLAQQPGVEVRVGRGPLTGDFEPQVVVMERDSGAPDDVPAAALKFLQQAADRSVLLLDPQRSTLLVLSAHAMLVQSLTEIAACVEQVCRMGL